MQHQLIPCTGSPLVLSVDPYERTCLALPYGLLAADLEQRSVCDEIAILFAGDVAIGFWADLPRDPFSVDPLARPWRDLRFEVPVLLGEAAPADELLIMACAFAEHGTPDVMHARDARAQAEAGRLRSATDAARWSLAAGNPNGRLLLGELLLAAERAVDAYAQLRCHVRRHPGDARGWLLFGRACELRGDVPEARRAYTRLLQVRETGAAAAEARNALVRLTSTTLWDEPWT